MPRYMIELGHDSGQCVSALDRDEERAEDLLGEIYWGCMSGRHIGWTIVDAGSEAEALSQVPDNLRENVSVVQVDVIAPELARAIDPESANMQDVGPFTPEPPQPAEEQAS